MRCGEPNRRYGSLLTARPHRPRHRCVANQSPEIVTPHSITSSAPLTNGNAMSSPSVFAVFRLMTNSLCGLHDRKIGRFLAFENSPGVDADLMPGLA